MDLRFYIQLVLIGILWIQHCLSCTLNTDCSDGACSRGVCVCNDGIWGLNCEYGRRRLKNVPGGQISDGSGKYVVNSRRIWLVDSESANQTIAFRLDDFLTECTWDHLYIYDGKSTVAPLIAALSGDIQPKGSGKYLNTPARMLLAHSGAAYLDFHSDGHLVSSGFNISYRISSCPIGSCSGRGFCNEQNQCECEEGWSGPSCEQRACCLNGRFDMMQQTYLCDYMAYDSNCSVQVSGRASHAVTLYGDMMWVYGGYSFTEDAANNLLEYNLVTGRWRTAIAHMPIASRYGHSSIHHEGMLYIFGGTTENGVVGEIWKFDIGNQSCAAVNPSGDSVIAVSGHSAVAVDRHMFMFMGYSERLIGVAEVQRLDLDTLQWKILETSGARVNGVYGSTATYDPLFGLIYVYGGYLFPQRSGDHALSDRLHSFNPATNSWTALVSSSHPKMLHSAAILGRSIVFYGGRSYNDSFDVTDSTRCYSDGIILYDIDCQQWKPLSGGNLGAASERYGHSAVSTGRKLFIFGGFHGIVRDDLLILTNGNCSALLTMDDCIRNSTTGDCIWDGSCKNREEIASQSPDYLDLLNCTVRSNNVVCPSYRNCSHCLTTGCRWHSGSCNGAVGGNASMSDQCSPAELQQEICQKYSSCYRCEALENCTWSDSEQYKCSAVSGKKATSVSSCEAEGQAVQHCFQLKTCADCRKNPSRLHCLWCESKKKCVETAAFVPSFPFGQCKDWSVNSQCKDFKCSSRKDCQSCFEASGCGWCEDTSNTGIGKCVQGSADGPFGNTTVCPQRWHFTDCPDCMCSGHSKCLDDGKTCDKCLNNTTGLRCESCAPGYYGDALNNGSCTTCYCNKHGIGCHPQTGVCRCGMKGVTGPNCEACDYQRGYKGNATNGGNCFFTLLVGFQYTYNITDAIQVNFINGAIRSNKDVTLDIRLQSGGPAYVNVSLFAGGSRTESFIVTNHSLGYYSRKFSENELDSDSGSPSIHIYLYGWNTHASFLMAITEGPTFFDLVYFLIVFLVCFCALLVIFLIVWRLKIFYDSYRRTRRRNVELDQMASRPFASTSYVLSDNSAHLRERQKPTPLALETFAHGNSGVASVLVEFPRAGKGVAPVGQAAVCIASTLVLCSEPKFNSSNSPQRSVKANKKKRRIRTPVNV